MRHRGGMFSDFPWGGEPDLSEIARPSENLKGSPQMLKAVRLTNDVGV